jgi:glycosyltransferase involved in cell wall biosynthesis
MAPKNILVVTNLYPYPWEPNRAAFNRQQFETLAEISNVNVIVLVPWRSALGNFAKLKATTIKNVGIDYCVYFYLPKIGRSIYPLFILPSLLTRFWKIKKFKADCMLLSWAFPDAIAGGLLAKLLGIPTVVKVHGSDINVHAQMRAKRVQIKWAMDQAKAVIAVSQDLKNKIVQMGVSSNKVHLLYNGIDKSLFYPLEKAVARELCAIDINRQVIVFIGNLKVSKGCNLLLEAFALLTRKISAVDLYYIGAGDQMDTLQRKVGEYGLDASVHLLGSLPHKALPPWMNASDVLALPSMNEGVPNVILEAQACGTPVVATSVGGIPEIVSAENGILIEYGDEQKLCNALIEALNKNWDRLKISNNVNTLSWAENSAKLLNIINTADVG